MRKLKKITLRSLSIISAFAFLFFLTETPSFANGGSDNGALVIRNNSGEWACRIQHPNGSIYYGYFQAVITPSGKHIANCDAKLVFGPGVDKLYRSPYTNFGDIIITPAGTAHWNWKDVPDQYFPKP